MDSNLMDRAYDISPTNTAVYGVLVVILVTAVIYLWKYLIDFINKNKEQTEKIIERNTLAFEKYNQRLEDEKKKETNLETKMIVLIEKTSILIDNFSSNEDRLVSQIEKTNRKLIDEVKKIK